MKELHNKMKNWFRNNADRAKALFWLDLIAFFESSVFPIPPDIFLIIFVLVKPQKWAKFALHLTIFSVLGGIFTYLIGMFLFDTFGEALISFYSLQNEIALISGWFESTAFFTILIAAFTPIPYKVFILSAGVFGINILTLVVASLIGRGARFFLVAFIFRFFGEKYSKQILKYFNTISLIAGIFILIYLVLQFL